MMAIKPIIKPKFNTLKADLEISIKDNYNSKITKITSRNKATILKGIKEVFKKFE